jgi:hypothetical protein
LKKTLILVVVVTGLCACTKEVSKLVDQDKIWTHYQLFYNENDQKTYATAEFRFSTELGTRLMLSDPSTVSVDGTAMEWSPETGNYITEFNGFITDVEFNWVDLDGNSFTNSIEIRDIDYPTVLDDSLFHSDSVNYFMWEGAPLDSFESVTLTLDGRLSSTDRREFSVDTFNATTITIDSSTLLQVDSGIVDLFLDKFYSPELSESTSRGGLLVGKYRPINREVYLD